MSLVNSVDQIIKDLGVNPYFVTVGVLASLFPLAKVIWKLSTAGLSSLASTAQVGYKRSQIRKIRQIAKKYFRFDQDGLLKPISESKDQLAYEIKKQWYNLFDIIFGASCLSLILSISESRYILDIVASFVATSALTNKLSLSREFKDDIIRRRLEIRLINRVNKLLEGRKPALEAELQKLAGEK